MAKKLMIFLLLGCFIVGCAILPETSNIVEVTNTEQNPALGTVEASVVPTMTIEPTKTSMPKEIQDIEELTRWIDNYVKANDGKVQINGVEMDRSQLEAEVRNNIKSYLVTKYVNNSGTQFLVINSTPIAIKADGEKWKEATLKMLGDIVGVKIGTLLGDPNISKIFIDTYWRNEYHIGVSCFDNSNITRNGETDWDWSNTQFQMAKTNDLETRLQAVLFGLYRPSWA
ncbi:MAG: hypothetical protein FP831_01775, partial [Anaerolineae bacterium]|nr:hypothetical protein [Anaerolineae bacterium]